MPVHAWKNYPFSLFFCCFLKWPQRMEWSGATRMSFGSSKSAAPWRKPLRKWMLIETQLHAQLQYNCWARNYLSRPIPRSADTWWRAHEDFCACRTLPRGYKWGDGWNHHHIQQKCKASPNNVQVYWRMFIEQCLVLRLITNCLNMLLLLKKLIYLYIHSILWKFVSSNSDALMSCQTSLQHLCSPEQILACVIQTVTG